ncbi:MAG: hypothetical protein IPP19_15285, partial [Verrucomicrobia bacterium]|nr:hypothetical protein [Verrucomicrobiota bacterium]
MPKATLGLHLLFPLLTFLYQQFVFGFLLVGEQSHELAVQLLQDYIYLLRKLFAMNPELGLGGLENRVNLCLLLGCNAETGDEFFSQAFRPFVDRATRRSLGLGYWFWFCQGLVTADPQTDKTASDTASEKDTEKYERGL